MAPTLTELFASPDYYLHSFDDEDALFVAMDRDSYRRSIFLDHRISPAKEGVMRLPVRALLAGVLEPPPTAWIFHMAHCGSTLLARALEALGGRLVLREPLALRQLGLAPNSARLALALRLLGKRYPGDGATLIKANVPVNVILADIAAAAPDARTVFLHFGLRDYLLAILRSDNHRRWLRRLTAEFAGHLGDLSGLADSELAAALWLAQTRRFAAAIAQMPNARTLDAETFFADPARAILAAAECLGIEAEEARVSQLVHGPLFATYSKNPALAFDNAARLARRAKLEAALGPEIASADAWLVREAKDAEALGDALRARSFLPG